MEHVEEREDMLFVAAYLARPNVIDNHVTNFFWAMRLVAQKISKCSSSNLG
jgi:hypothetical protein